MQAIRLRGNLLPTQVRSARGRRRTGVSCNLCYGNRPESLSHILQQCPATAGPRLPRHNGLLEKYISCFQQKRYHTRCKAAVPSVAGVRYSDIICWKQNQSHVIDVQVVADAVAGSLDAAHMRKMAYYNTLDICGFVEALTGTFPISSSFTMSWRAVLALPSFNTWSSLECQKLP